MENKERIKEHAVLICECFFLRLSCICFGGGFAFFCYFKGTANDKKNVSQLMGGYETRDLHQHGDKKKNKHYDGLERF